MYTESGVINDPLGQPTIPSGNDFHLILKFWDGRTDGRTTCAKLGITTGRDCGWPRGSMEPGRVGIDLNILCKRKVDEF